MAWPKVWPRFSKARPPSFAVSSSSAATTSALFAHERSIACERAALSLPIILSMFASSHSRKGRSRINPYLMTSAKPADSRCFPIQDIELEGADALSSTERERLLKPYLGQCLGVTQLNGLLKVITDLYIQKPGLPTEQVCC